MNSVARIASLLVLLPAPGFAQIVPAAGSSTIVLPQGQQIQVRGGVAAGTNLFHRFDRFNLDANQTATFFANPAIQNIFGRVVSGEASRINGLIQVNGNANLVLMNPAGILFGATARLDVSGSFTATTANRIGIGSGVFDAIGANNDAALIGTPSYFELGASGGIFNAGNLTAGQTVSLFGGTVLNTGTVNGQTVSIAAVPENRAIRVTPEGSLLSLEIPNSSNIAARTLPELLTGGELQSATQATIRDGIPTLTRAGTAIVSGNLSGSNVQIVGDRIGLIDATLRGESIRVGGDRQGMGDFPRSQFLFGNSGTQIEGRNVILWSDQATRFHGSITANNGFVETSGKQVLDVSQARISAVGGTWLLDPSDITIASGGTGTLSSGVFDPPAGGATIDPAVIEAALNNNTSVTITTANGSGGSGDITLLSSITQTGSQASLTFTGRQLLRANNAQINLSGTNFLVFNLNQVEPLSSLSALSIQNAIDAIGTGSGSINIHLGAGTYTSTGTPLQISTNRNLTISGNGSANTMLTGNNAARVIEVDPGATVTIANLAIAEGKAPAGQSGGGILNLGNLVLRDVNVRNNVADLDGGGLSNAGTVSLLRSNFLNNISSTDGGAISTDGTLTIDQSQFRDNRAFEQGGAISNSGNTTIVNSILSGNTALGAVNSGGGAIYTRGAASILTISNSQLLNNRSNTGGAIDSTFPNAITIDNSLIQGNIADGEAGAILIDRNSTLTIRNSQILNNQSNGDAGAIYISAEGRIENTVIRNNRSAGGNGGGIYTIGQVNLINSRVIGNSAINGGGFYIDPGSAGDAGSATITGTTIADNISTDRGGGIANTGQLTLTNSLIWNNAATQGGGLFSDETATLANTTISANTATQGGGLFTAAGTTELQSTTIANNTDGLLNFVATVRLRNTIVADNLNYDVSGLFNDLGNNLIGISDGSAGFTVSSLVGTQSSPIVSNLAPLANNGGLTLTHALLPNSPAIDRGNNLNVSSFDQVGRLRIQGNTIDIGAFESTPIPPVPVPPPSAPVPPILPSTPIDAPVSATPPLFEPPTNTPSESNPKTQQPVSTVIELERSLSQEYADYYNFELPKVVTLQEIQDMLAKAQHLKGARSGIIYALFVPSAITPAPKSGEVLTDQIEPITPLLRSQLKQESDRLELFLITPTGRAIRYSTTATRAQVAQQAKLFRLAVSDVEDEGYLALSRQLYQWLVQPLEPELQRYGIQGLIYCLDEGLRTAPIAAMADDRGFVIDRYTVSMIPSVTLINRDIHSLTSKSVLAMGADYFREQAPLPAVSTELQLISEQFWNGNRFLNQDFTLERLLQEKQRTQAGIVHLATHAEFNPGSPDRSYIQLWNRRISLSEMSSIAWSNPALHLLVLSACETAIDSVDAELGFTGLAAASGVHSVMGSLWEVSDVGTLALMSEFYIQLQKVPTRADALRRAQLALRNGTVRIENGALVTSTIRVPLPPALQQNSDLRLFNHPFYWAAFTLVGNPW